MACLKTLHWEGSSEAAQHTFTTPRSVFKVWIKQKLKKGKVDGGDLRELDQNDGGSFQGLVKVTA